MKGIWIIIFWVTLIVWVSVDMIGVERTSTLSIADYVRTNIFLVGIFSSIYLVGYWAGKN